LVNEAGAEHVDLNFGCPVRKVTAQGGGAALPHKPLLLAKIIRATVNAVGSVPVTAKFRLGVDQDHLVYMQTGHIAQEEGCAAVTLHARTAAQLYSGHADWTAIGELKNTLRIPVFGNGDIWEAADALRMMRQTRCDGIVVGRGCLGRPWLFQDLSAMYDGRRPDAAPNVGRVVEIMLEHAKRQAAWLGERSGVIAFRRQAAWYTKGLRASAAFRHLLMQIDSLSGLASAVAALDAGEPFPACALRVPRCKDSGTQRVSLPAGFFDNPYDETLPPEHDAFDGG
jgi:nifR3 family TIM-barrel protein